MDVRRSTFFLAFALIWLWPGAIHVCAQQTGALPAIVEGATGTGRTTGHIADVLVINERDEPVYLVSQFCFVPSDTAFQSYVGRIPGGLVLPPQSRMIVPLFGFCTDVYAPPVPIGRKMPDPASWIAIHDVDSALLRTFRPHINEPRLAIDLQTGDTIRSFGVSSPIRIYRALVPDFVEAFKPSALADLLQSQGFSSTGTSPDSVIITWPDTRLPVQGVMDAKKDAHAFARLVARVVQRLEEAAMREQQAAALSTPFSPDRDRELEAVIQHGLWIYTASLTGKPYRKGTFSEKVNIEARLTAGSDVATGLPADKANLDVGIDQFWAAFSATGVAAGVLDKRLAQDPGRVVQTTPIVPASDTIRRPWSAVTLTGERMKPFYTPSIATVIAPAPSPWIPVTIGALSAGTLVYLSTLEKQDPTGCDFSATASVTPATCGQGNGSISIMTDVTDSLAYAWIDGATTANRTQLTAGDYTVTITRAGTTCSQVLAVTVPSETISFNVSLTATDPDCGQANGSVTGTADPPGEYTWTWSTGASTPDIGELPAGSYALTVSAGGNCTQTQSITLQDKPFDPAIDISSTPANCGSTNGTASVTVDPAGMYDYAWSNGSAGAQVSGLAPGNYVVTVSLSGTSCAKTADVTIDESEAAFTLSVSSTPAGCGQADGTATVTVDPPGAYDFLWSDGQATAQAGGLAAGEYTVSVTVQGTTCTKNISVTVEALPPAFTLSASATGTPCGLADGTASVSVDPPGDYQYAWSDGQRTQTITSLLPGTYTVTVTQTGTTCAREATVVVDELPPVFTAAFDVTPADCQAANGGANVTIDPPAEYMYQWSNGSTGPGVTGLAAGAYAVTVTIVGTNCAKDFSVVVGQTGISFAATLSTVNADCGVANGSATATVDPPGEYTYTWSNQQSGPVLQDVPAGPYSVIIADTNGCTLTLQTDILEDPPAYVLPGDITPGNCTGGGEAIITLITPGAGPIELQVTTPSGTINTTLPPGTYPLSLLTEVTGGLYVLEAFDQQIGAGCTQVIEITVPDNTPPVVALDDTYATTAGSSVGGNVLDNDSGLDLQVTNVGDIVGGTVTFDPGGDFTFTPQPGFSGDGGFVYTVTDACGSTATAQVNIVVQTGVCDFTVAFDLLPATCGLPDGMITATVDPPGTYLYMWSNGGTGASILDVPGGEYSVTVVDPGLGCDLVFTTTLAENPPNTIESPAVEQPSCDGPGEISFLAQTPSGNQLEMTITHPGGTSVFVIPPGPVQLSGFIPIVPGTYVVEVMDVAAGPACVESFGATLASWQMINIVAETILPPSTPTAMDGEVLVVAVTEGVLPYTILLNDLPYGTANDHVFTVEGLGVGEHIIQVIDAAGCPSNQLFVVVPPPDIVLDLTAGWQTGSVYVGQSEQPTYAGQALGFVLGASMTKWHERWGQEINLSWMPALSRAEDGAADLIQAEFLFKPLPWQSRKLTYSVKGGPAIRHAPGTSLFEPFLLLRADGTLRLVKGVSVSAFLGAEAGARFLRPSAGVQLILPLRFPVSPAGMMSLPAPLESSLFSR